MKIGKKELSILLYLFGVLFVLGAVVYGNSLASTTETLVRENDSLSQEVAYLQDLADHQQEYEAESERMNLEMEDIKEQFPAEVRQENQIMYANGLEAKLDIMLAGINMPGTELVTIEGDFSAQPATVATTDEVTGEVTETTTGDATTTVDAAPAISSAATTISLFKSSTSFEYQASYKGLKDLIRTINEDAERKSIENLTIGYNTETGNLAGSVVFNMYALSGTDKEYQAPVVTGVTDGVQQLFTGATTLNRDGTANKAGDSATADGKTENETTEETTESEE